MKASIVFGLLFTYGVVIPCIGSGADILANASSLSKLPLEPMEKQEIRPTIESLNCGLLTTLRIYATTTSWRENKKRLNKDIRLGLIHEGSADVVVDLSKAKIEKFDDGEGARIRVILPLPYLDTRTIGINPGKIQIKVSHNSTARPEDYAKLRDEVFVDIVDKLKTKLANFDISAAKMQALLVLSNLYAQAGYNDVEIVWDEAEHSSPSARVSSDLIHQGGAQ
mgnify:CR=1 FL=1